MRSQTSTTFSASILWLWHSDIFCMWEAQYEDYTLSYFKYTLIIFNSFMWLLQNLLTLSVIDSHIMTIWDLTSLCDTRLSVVLHKQQGTWHNSLSDIASWKHRRTLLECYGGSRAVAAPTVVGKTVTIGWDILHTGTTHCDSWKHLLYKHYTSSYHSWKTSVITLSSLKHTPNPDMPSDVTG